MSWGIVLGRCLKKCFLVNDLGVEMWLVNIFNPKKTRWWFQICLHNFYFGFVGKIANLMFAYFFRWLVDQPPTRKDPDLKLPFFWRGSCWETLVMEGFGWSQQLEDAEPWRISSGCGPVTVMANEGLVGDSWGYPKNVLILMMTVAAGHTKDILCICNFCWPKSAMQTTPPIYTRNKIGTNPRIYTDFWDSWQPPQLSMDFGQWKFLRSFAEASRLWCVSRRIDRCYAERGAVAVAAVSRSVGVPVIPPL